MIQRHFRVVTVTIVIIVAAIVAAVVVVVVVVADVDVVTSVAKCLLISHDQRFQ